MKTAVQRQETADITTEKKIISSVISASRTTDTAEETKTEEIPKNQATEKAENVTEEEKADFS